MVLVALGMTVMLAYAVAAAVVTRDGYAALKLRREIEDIRAQNALLRYQINLVESSARIEQAAQRLGLQRVDPVQQVDYVVLPASDCAASRELAQAEGRLDRGGLGAALMDLAAEVIHPAGGRAEASTDPGHRP